MEIVVFIHVNVTDNCYIIYSCYTGTANVWMASAMEERDGAGFFLEIVVVIAILSCLSAVALPDINRLIGKGKPESRDSELHGIQTAVTEMLVDSAAGTLKPVGPTADMSLVQTSDTPPLVLSDYLFGLDGTSVKSGCSYTFAADGTVIQIPP